MPSQDIDRRAFLRTSAQAGMTMCGLCICSQLPLSAFAGDDDAATAAAARGEQETLDPKKLCYCGYRCPPDCKLLKATRENDVALKQEAYGEWKIKERFGLEFDPEQVICHGCKTEDKPLGIVLQRCTVRSCAKEKKLDCCIECSELESCDKDLWQRFPTFKAHVMTMQEQYKAQD